MIAKKISQRADGWKALGVVFIGPSMLALTTLSPEHSITHRFSVAALGIGAMIMAIGSSTFLPCVCLAAASLMGALFGYTGVFRIPILIVLVLGVLALIYAWWRDRQTKKNAERQTYRP